MELRPAGAAPTSSPVLSSTLTAKAGAAYTLAGLGSLASPRLATLQDDLTPPTRRAEPRSPVTTAATPNVPAATLS